MDKDIMLLEKEKLRLENEKLKRDIELNTEFRMLELEQRKIDEDQNRQKIDYKRAIAALILTAFSILVTAIITTISSFTTESINKATIKINEETLRQMKLERIDMLKSEFDDDETSREQKSSIAYELIHVADSTLLSAYDRARYADFYNSFFKDIKDKKGNVEESQSKLDARKGTITPDEIKALNEAEQKQVWLENKLTATEDSKVRARIENQINAISDNIPVGKKTQKVAKELDTLSTAQKELTSYKKESSLTMPGVTWLKERYSRPYGDIVVTLEQLNEKERSGVVNITGNADGNHFAERIAFTVPGKKTFIYQGRMYELEFVKIDRAGKNPFTKAVYFTVLKLAGKSKFASGTSLD